MKYRQAYWFEKYEVEVAAGLALAATYFCLWPMFRYSDPYQAMSFFAGGGTGKLMSFALCFWALAAICSIVTITARPQGAIVAALFGAGGLSLRSPQFRSLLWEHDAAIGPLYRSLMAEVLALGGVLVVGLLIAWAVRAAIRQMNPQWVWPDAVDDLPPEATPAPASDRYIFVGDVVALLGLARLAMGKIADRGQPKPAAASRKLALAGAMGADGWIAAALLLATMRSGDRGQIVFALFASFFLAGLISHQVLPAPVSGLAWVLPFVLAIAFYALGAASSVPAGPQSWSEVPFFARALPIDWLTAGCGGVMFGYWSSARMHEARFIERREQEGQ